MAFERRKNLRSAHNFERLGSDSSAGSLNRTTRGEPCDDCQEKHCPRSEDHEKGVPYAMAGQTDAMLRQNIHGEEERDDEKREGGCA